MKKNNVFVIRDSIRDKLSKWNVELLENDELYLFKFTYKNGKGLVDRIYRTKKEIDNIQLEDMPGVIDTIYNDFVCDLLDFFLDKESNNDRE